ncbi:MAG TPA: alpha/beta hydrolase [Thermomonospora sp.]|nr:alpha/beta hydrolase [Thermomonospora sp.]
MRLTQRALAIGVAGTALLTVATAAHAAPQGSPQAPDARVTQGTDTTSPVERKRVDRVPTPKPGWFKCFTYAECGTVRLPVDYDRPKGPTTEIAVLRIKARKPAQRIGSLFVNPGGPGGQGTAMAFEAPNWLGPEVLDRFDIVGFDPRGIGFSDNVRCFTSFKQQTQAMTGWDVPFPVGRKQEGRFIASAKALGRACSTTGKTLAGAMSTAEAARDMDVLRRAVGDRKLSFLGFSYGTALGQYYANMFPDRVRAVVADGVINPVSWVGTPKTQNQILDDRLRSADGAYKALRELLARCGKAGRTACEFAQFGDPVKNFGVLAERLKRRPVDLGGGFRVTYAGLVADMLALLYNPDGFRFIDAVLTELWTASAPPGTVTAAARDSAVKSLAARVKARRAAAERERRALRRVLGRGFPYDNSADAFSGVTCTDARHPQSADAWPALTAASDRRAPYFGRMWGWSSVQCARASWTVRDEDAYMGPFNRRTIAPVLFVGNYYDPATNYNDAVSSDRLLPNSRLLSSDSWGHTAYGTSACVTKAVDAYLVRRVLPAAGTVCVGDVQPFAAVPPPARTVRRPANASTMASPSGPEATGRHLPPVAPRFPVIR